MPGKRGNKIRLMLYFFLVALLLLFLFLHAFGVVQLQTDFFTRFLIGLLFILLVLPLVPYVKVFDIVEMRREARIFKAGNTGKLRNRKNR
ncbi:hypothetical protein HYV82_05600 [Candidatus Woesearchaeota archaeon]|nr:hypothetical protein [Candidatus Woesearchaeota archaeon]